jgi:hypothetical protein
MEYNIPATVTVLVELLMRLKKPYDSVKFVENCEYRLSQSPGDAIEPGCDHEAKFDMIVPDFVICNYQPLTKVDVQQMVDDSIKNSKSTPVTRDFLQEFLWNECAR